MNGSQQNSTRWTLIVRAQGAGAGARVALGELLRQYDGFVLWLICRHGHPPDVGAEDLKQEFLTGVLRRDDIAKLDQKRGSFRGWLTTAVRRFLFNEWDKWKTETAGRQKTAPTLFEEFHNSTPEDVLCTRVFAAHAVLHVLSAQRGEARDPQRFDNLVRFLPGPQMDLAELAPVACSLGMSRTALAKAICEMRARFRELLRAEIRDTLDLDEADEATPDALSLEATSRIVDEEMCNLRRHFQDCERTDVVLDPT